MSGEALVREICSACADEEAVRDLIQRLSSLLTKPGNQVGDCAERLRQEGVFDLLPTAVQQTLSDDPFHQDHDLEGGITTFTSVRLDEIAPQQVLEALLNMPWDRWWCHAEVDPWRQINREDGVAVSFGFKPLRWLPVKVGIQIEPPIRKSEGTCGITRDKFVLKSKFTGNFVGPALFEIIGVPGGSTLRASWQKVQPGGWTHLLTRHRMAANHLASERGTMPFFPGSGYLGMMRYLRREAQLP